MLPPLLAMDITYVWFARDMPVDGWLDFLLKAVVVGAPGLIAGFAFGLGRDERGAVLRKLGIKTRATSG